MTAILDALAVSTAHGGSVVHDPSKDTFSATLRCHNANSEFCMVNASCNLVTISTYEDDVIRIRIETWADTDARFEEFVEILLVLKVGGVC